MSESQYSEAALAKQAAADAKMARGERLTITDIAGIAEPRVKPTTAERCVCCGLDARDDQGGEEHYGVRWCFICVGRDHPEPQTAAPDPGLRDNEAPQVAAEKEG